MLIQELPKLDTNGKAPMNPIGIDLRTAQKREFIIEVNPVTAQWLLENMHPRQRSISRDEVRHFESLIRSGKFVELMHPGIWCNQAGQVCNARHRLTAQVNEQATFKWYLRLGCPDEEIAALDQVRPRRHYQSINLTLEGMTAPMNDRESAALRVYRRLLRGGDEMETTDRRISVEDLLEMREKCGPDVAWALNALPKAAGPAAMVGAIAFTRPVDPGGVARFVEIYVSARLATGDARAGKNAPAMALARIMNTKGKAGSTYTQQTVNSTLSAVRAHLEGRELQKVYSDAGYAKPLRWFRARRGE